MGKSVQLRCSATVSFDTKIYWQRMDNNTALKFRQQQQTQGNVIQTILYIKEIEKNDFGFYGCFAESKIGKTHVVIELRGKFLYFNRKYKYYLINFIEHRRSTNAQTIDKDELSTARIQILKRNKSKIIFNKLTSKYNDYLYLVSDQTTMLMKTNKASTCFSLFYLAIIFIQNIFYNLT